MAEPVTAMQWAPRGAWTDVLRDGRIGSQAAAPGVMIEAREELGIAAIIASDGGEAALAAALKERLGLDLPGGPAAICAGNHALIWTGPSQWLLLADARDGFTESLAALAPLAAVSDQSDARAILRLSGPRIREALAKGCMIDLHPSAFPTGSAALTSIAHMGVCLWRAADGPEGPVFEIMVARSMAGSFWSWLSASAAEFGCLVSTGRG